LGNLANEGTSRRRGNNGSAVIYKDQIIVPVGSPNGACLVSFNKKNGTVVWKSLDDETAYSSLQIATFSGQDQVVAFTAEALAGVDAKTGAPLWRVPLRTNAKRHAATPVIHDDTVMVNSHTFGVICFRVAHEGNAWSASELWKNSQMKINLATPIRLGDACYSHGPDKNFVCFDANNGQQLWSATPFGKEFSGALAIKDRLLVVTDQGELVLVKADRTEYGELGRWQICGKTWSSPAFAEGALFVRDQKNVLAFSLIPAR
jgi:outer membrane protein assembly factor BamB